MEQLLIFLNIMYWELIFISSISALYLITIYTLETIERIKKMKIKDKFIAKIDGLRKELHKYNELCEKFFKKK